MEQREWEESHRQRERGEKKQAWESHSNELFIMRATLIIFSLPLIDFFFIARANSPFELWVFSRNDVDTVSRSSYDSPQFKRNDITYVHDRMWHDLLANRQTFVDSPSITFRYLWNAI